MESSVLHIYCMWDSRMLLWHVKSMNRRLYQHSTGGTFTVGSISAFSQESLQHRYTESSWWALLSHGSNCNFHYYSRLHIYNAAPWDYEKPCSSKVCRDPHLGKVPLCSLAFSHDSNFCQIMAFGSVKKKGNTNIHCFVKARILQMEF